MLNEWSTLRKLLFYSATASKLTDETVSGNPAVFETDVEKPLKSMLIPFYPVQDLHGQTTPYIGGNGINRWDELWEKGKYNTSTGEKESSDNIRSADLFPISPSTTYYVYVGSGSHNMYIVLYDENKAYVENKNASNGTFTTGETAAYMAFYMTGGYGLTYLNDISINDPSTDHNYHPYANICPITGWTGVNINRTGKNMFHINGTDMVSNGWNRYFPNSFTKPGTYRFSCGKQWGGTGQKGGIIGFKDSPSNTASRIGDTIGTYAFGNSSYSFTATITEEQAKAKYMYFGCSSENAPASTFTDAEFQLELGTTATAYEPYSGETRQIVFPAQGKNLLSVPSFSLGGTEPRTKRVSIVPIPAGTYKLSGVKTGTSTANFGFQFFDSEVGGTNIGSGSIGSTITLSGEAVSVYVYMNQADYNESKTVILNELQLEEGSTATAYEPFDNTIYGGELDLTTGVLMVDKAKTTVNNLSWTYDTTNTRFVAPIADLKQYSSNRITTFLSPVFATIDDGRAVGNVPNNGIYGVGNSKSVFVKCTDYTTGESFKTAYGVQTIVYPLATPITYQLDPVTLSTLKGDNTIWTDTNGTNEITYKKKG